MKSQMVAKLTAILIFLILFLSVAAQPARARPPKKDTTVVKSIPEDDRSWAGLPWIISSVLAAGAVAVGMKNAKRSHLD